MAHQTEDQSHPWAYTERITSESLSSLNDTTSSEDTTSSDSNTEDERRVGRGRPRGSKNKPKDLSADFTLPVRPAKPRGRPAGAKNKLKVSKLLSSPVRKLQLTVGGQNSRESINSALPLSTYQTVQDPVNPSYIALSHSGRVHMEQPLSPIASIQANRTEPREFNYRPRIAKIEITRSKQQKANKSSSSTVAGGTIPPPLPPSVEEAYRKKCIELRRRMTEVEEANNALRVRKVRIQRGIRKMRLERAYLLDILHKRMGKNGGSIDGIQGIYDEDSEGSSEAPPTPNEKPLRSKRSHRRPASSPPPMSHPQHRPLAPSGMHPTSAFEGPPRDPFRESQYQHIPTANNQGPMPLQFQPPQPQPSAIPSNANSNPMSPSGPAPPHLRRTIVPPPTAFDEFLMQHILPNREQFRFRNDDEAVQMAREAWNDPGMEQAKAVCVENYERNMQRYTEEMREFERMAEIEQRRELEGQGQGQGQREVLPPPPPQARESQGGGGGFTSING